MVENTNSTVHTSRRDVLKTSGAIAGLNIIGVVPSEELGDVSSHLTEVGYEYTPVSDIKRSTLPVIHTDFSPPYHVDHANKNLITNPYGDPTGRAEQVLKDNRFIVRGKKYHAGKSTLFTERTDRLTYLMERDFRRTYTLNLIDPVPEHEVTVYRENADTIVTTDSIRERVRPNEEIRTKLDPIDVVVETIEVLDKKVQNDSIAEFRRPLQKKREVKTVSLTPKLRVRNLGKMTVQKGKPQ